MTALTEAELGDAADGLIAQYMYNDEPASDANYDAVKVVAKRRLMNYMSVDDSVFTRTTPVSLIVASRAASLLDGWRNPPSHILDGDDD